MINEYDKCMLKLHVQRCMAFRAVQKYGNRQRTKTLNVLPVFVMLNETSWNVSNKAYRTGALDKAFTATKQR